MAQVHGYDYDIFISYTHNDNHTPGDNPGWVDSFHDSLESWLVKRRGLSKLKIWRDTKRMDGITVFDDAIENAVSSSALFFALHSRNYLKSSYCEEELDWFHQYNSDRPGGLRVGKRLRIFNILLNNIPHQEWLQALGKTSGLPMHDAESDPELGEFTSPNDDRFEKQLRKIVDAVQEILEGFPAKQKGEPDKHKVQIFVADVADTLQTFRDRIITEVQGKDAHILSDIPPPMESAQHADSVKKAIAQAHFSIHLFDPWPGRKIVDKKETTYPREQLEIALKSKTLQLIWVLGELKIADIEDETQRSFIDNLANGARESAQYEFVRDTQSDFSNLILQKIVELQNRSQNGAAAHTFLVDTHQKDQRYAYKLANFLADKGVDVEFNKESRDPTLSLTYFEHAVKHVKNLIIMFGRVDPSWLQGRIKKAANIVAEHLFEVDDTLENIWVYLLPGSKGTVGLPRVPRLFNIELLDNSRTESIDPNVAARLLNNGKAGGGK